MRLISLPIFPAQREEEVEWVIGAVEDVVVSFRLPVVIPVKVGIQL